MLFSQGCTPELKQTLTNFENYMIELDKTLQKKVRKILDEEDTKKSINYKESTGLLIEITSFKVDPSHVKREEKVHLSVEYSVLGADKGGVQIRDTKILLHNNKTIATLSDEEIKRKNGTWESTMTFIVPKSADLGLHKVKQAVTTGYISSQSLGFFTVTQ